MRAIILAAGRGRRMGSRTENLPKCLTELWGKPLLAWQIEVLRASGINEIGIVRGYMPEKINVDEAVYFENKDWETTNMVSSLLCAREWLRNYECIVSYSDIIYSKDAVKTLLSATDDISITSYSRWLELWKQRCEDPLSDVEKFRIDHHRRLLDIGKGAETLDEIQGQYMGLLKFTPKGWSAIESALSLLDAGKIKSIDMTTLLKHLINNGIDIHTKPYDGIWLEVDNEKDLMLYEQWEIPSL
jgi:L-glutamine-phosphate cytidylyltransferase